MYKIMYQSPSWRADYENVSKSDAYPLQSVPLDGLKTKL